MGFGVGESAMQSYATACKEMTKYMHGVRFVTLYDYFPDLSAACVRDTIFREHLPSLCWVSEVRNGTSTQRQKWAQFCGFTAGDEERAAAMMRYSEAFNDWSTKAFPNALRCTIRP